MKFAAQLGVIIGVSFLGEVLAWLLPLPVPAGIYGLLLMLLVLCTGLVKLPQVEATGNFLVEILPLLLVPVSVGLMNVWEALRTILLPLLLLCTVGTLVVMAVSGLVTQALLARGKGQPHE